MRSSLICLRSGMPGISHPGREIFKNAVIDQKWERALITWPLKRLHETHSVLFFCGELWLSRHKRIAFFGERCQESVILHRGLHVSCVVWYYNYKNHCQVNNQCQVQMSLMVCWLKCVIFTLTDVSLTEGVSHKPIEFSLSLSLPGYKDMSDACVFTWKVFTSHLKTLRQPSEENKDRKALSKRH